MVNTQLFDFIKAQLSLGTDKNKLKSDLMKEGGWTSADIDEAFSILGVDVHAALKPSTPPPLPTTGSPVPPYQPTQASSKSATVFSFAPPVRNANIPESKPQQPSPQSREQLMPEPISATQAAEIMSYNTPLSPSPDVLPTAPKTAMNHPGPVATMGVTSEGVKYAGFWVRYAAFTIDTIFVAIPVILVQTLLLPQSSNNTQQYVLAEIIYFLLLWLYFVITTYAYSATPGKKMLGIMVARDDFSRLSFGRILARETIGKLVSAIIIYLGFIMAAFTSRKQALHDKIASSVVIYRDPNKKRGFWFAIAVIVAAAIPVLVILGILASVVLFSISRGSVQPLIQNVSNNAIFKSATSSTPTSTFSE